MTIALFDPYGSSCPESGFLTVLARYLQQRGFSLTSLRCSGILTACAKLEKIKVRSALSCLDCMRENDKNMHWAEIPSIDILPYLKCDDFLYLSQQTDKLSIKLLHTFTIEGVVIGEIISEQALSQFPPDRQVAVVLEAARLIKAFSTLLRERHFDGIFLPYGADLYIKSLALTAVKRGVRLFQLRWIPERHVMEINGGGEARTFYSELVFDQIDTLRSEVNSWPEEIRRRLEQVEEYLDITQQQLSLPMS